MRYYQHAVKPEPLPLILKPVSINTLPLIVPPNLEYKLAIDGIVGAFVMFP
jgi:hypothetical protein